MRRELKRWMEEHNPTPPDMLTEPVMTIGEAARATGLSESALRKYEAAGLILYHRSSGNVRVLSHEDLTRIRWIQKLIKKEGLNLEGIRRLWALLPCWECRGCTTNEQRHCPELSDMNRPCWMVHRDLTPEKTMECRQCGVYRLATRCTGQLKFLVHNANRPAFNENLLQDDGLN
ncbi:MAG: MerR family transcriptional regulator [bacterium]